MTPRDLFAQQWRPGAAHGVPSDLAHQRQPNRNLDGSCGQYYYVCCYSNFTLVKRPADRSDAEPRPQMANAEPRVNSNKLKGM